MSSFKLTDSLLKSGKPMPLISFPSSKLLGVSVYRLTHDARCQADGIIAVASHTDAAAAFGMMDLSVEAEAFGCNVVASENEIPTVVGSLITDEEEANALAVPQVGDKRTGLYIQAVTLAKSAISDRPVFAGMIGPFSLAGRLMDVSEALVNCIADPDFMHAALRKATEFLTAYAKAYKESGVDGIVMAEPLAGLLSPKLEIEFSAPYVKEIIESVQDENFSVIYHNCGPNTYLMTESLLGSGASAYHFGDAVDLSAMLALITDRPVCGNVSPSRQFQNGTPQSIYSDTVVLLKKCSKYCNFILSSGCDVPPNASWDNIDAFFRAANDFKTGVIL